MASKNPKALKGYRNGLKLGPNGYMVKFKAAGHGVHKSAHTFDLNEAKAFLASEKARVHEEARLSGLAKHGRLSAPTFEVMVEGWLGANAHGVRSERHVGNVKRTVERYLRDLLAIPIDKITQAHVDRLTTQLSQRLSGASVNHVLRTLKLLLNWAVQRDLVEKLPARISMLRLQKKRRSTLPLAQMIPFLGAVDEGSTPHVQVAVRLMLFLGLRVQEALGARWEWLDLEGGWYTPQVTKGREAQPLKLLFDLPEKLRALGPKPNGLILPRTDGHPHSETFTRKAITGACEKLGLPRLTPHRLRASFATLHASQFETPLPMVQKLMRHRDIETTMAYVEVYQGQLDEAQGKFEAALLKYVAQPDGGETGGTAPSHDSPSDQNSGA